MNFKTPLKYFSLKNSYEENKKLHRILANQYHPDKPTGNEDMMKEINLEWEKVDVYLNSVKKDKENGYENIGNKDLFWETIIGFSRVLFDDEDESEQQKNYITFKGIQYDLEDEDILRKVAMKHGGLSLLEFTSTPQWQDYINNL